MVDEHRTWGCAICNATFLSRDARDGHQAAHETSPAAGVEGGNGGQSAKERRYCGACREETVHLACGSVTRECMACGTRQRLSSNGSEVSARGD